MIIIAFPFAGGDKYSFNFLKPFLKEKGITFKVLEYSGRNSRAKELFCDNMDELIEDLLPKVLKLIDGEDTFYIYGHSMGALVGYLICKKLAFLNVKMPRKLIVSGRKPPSTIWPDMKVSVLPSEEFWNTLFSLGGVSKKLKNENELKFFFEPIIRSDFRIVESYIHNSNTTPIPVPVDVLYGSEESNNNGLDFLNWQLISSEQVNFEKYPGGHFFIYNYPKEILKYFNTSFEEENRLA